MLRSIAALCVGLAVLAGGVPARAQSATIEMMADRTHVAVGETFNVQVRADVTGGEAEDLTTPTFDAFQVVGRRVSRPMQFRFGFGNRQQVIQSSTVYDFTLRALAEGTYDIDAAKLTFGGRTYQSQPLRIVVGQGSGSTNVPSPDPSVPPANLAEGQEWDPTAFVRTVLDKETAWLGEQVTVTVYLYSRSGIRSAPTVHEEPKTDGFWVHDLLAPNRALDPHRQVVNGVAFNVYVLRRFAAFPLSAGEHEIGGMEVSYQQGSLFDIFNNQVAEIRRAGPAAKVNVRDLPAPGKPPGPIAVGDYTLEANLDRAQVATGDAVTLTAVVRGTGNVRDVRLELPEVQGLRVLSPQVQDDVTAPGDLVGGSRTYEWLIVPEQPGNHRIPPLSLGTFDPRTGQYETIEAPAMTLIAAGNAMPGGDVDEPDETAREVATDAPDEQLGPVRTRSDFEREHARIVTAPWFLALLALPPLAWLSVLLVAFARRRAEKRESAQGSQRAVKAARKRLSRAIEHADSGDARAFYSEIFRVLAAVLEARLGTPVGGFTHDELRRHLARRGMEADLVARTVDELEGLEFARFSATGVAREEMSACTARVAALIERLERFTPSEEES